MNRTQRLGTAQEVFKQSDLISGETDLNSIKFKTDKIPANKKGIYKHFDIAQTPPPVIKQAKINHGVLSRGTVDVNKISGINN